MKAYVKLMRLNVGIIAAISSVSGALFFQKSIQVIVVSFIGMLLLISAINILNQIIEIDLDSNNKLDRPLVTGEVSLAAAAIYSFSLTIGSQLLTYWFLGKNSLWIWLWSLVLGIIYSVKPIYLKKRFPINNLSIGMGYGILSFAYGGGIGITEIFSNLYVFVYLLITETIGSMTKDFRDEIGDKKFGISTIATVFGPKKASKIYAFAILLYIVPLAYLQNKKSLLVLTVYHFILQNIFVRSKIASAVVYSERLYLAYSKLALALL